MNLLAAVRFYQHLAIARVRRCAQRKSAVTGDSKPWCSSRHGDSGGTNRAGPEGSLFVRAVFSSTQNTSACWGSLTYSPIISAALSSKPGSLESCSVRSDGLKPVPLPHPRHHHVADAHSLRLLHCVEPSGAGRRVHFPDPGLQRRSSFLPARPR